MLRYHRPDDAATVDGEDGGDDGEARLQHQMVMMMMVMVMVKMVTVMMITVRPGYNTRW